MIQEAERGLALTFRLYSANLEAIPPYLWPFLETHGHLDVQSTLLEVNSCPKYLKQGKGFWSREQQPVRRPELAATKGEWMAGMQGETKIKCFQWF